MVRRYRGWVKTTQPRSPEAALGPVRPERRGRWRPGYWLRHPAIGVVLAGLMLSAVLYCGFGNLHARNVIVERGERAVGEVQGVWSGRRPGLRVKFTTQSGDTVWAGIGTYSSPDPRIVGNEVDVIYDRDDPVGNAHLAGREPGLLTPILIFGGGLVLGVAYWRWLRRHWNKLRSEAEAWREHRPVPRLGARRP